LPSFAALRAKFGRVDVRTSKNTYNKEKKPEINQEQIDDEEIANLGQHREAGALIKRLNKRLDEIESLMSGSLHSHPDMCALQGAKQEVRAIITQLEGKENEDG
jgi:hypothetical protein